MELHGGLHGGSWSSVVVSMEVRGPPWRSPWSFVEVSMEVRGGPWRSPRRLMELCGGLHGVPDNVGRRRYQTYCEHITTKQTHMTYAYKCVARQASGNHHSYAAPGFQGLARNVVDASSESSGLSFSCISIYLAQTKFLQEMSNRAPNKREADYAFNRSGLISYFCNSLDYRVSYR